MSKKNRTAQAAGVLFAAAAPENTPAPAEIAPAEIAPAPAPALAIVPDPIPADAVPSAPAVVENPDHKPKAAPNGEIAPAARKRGRPAALHLADLTDDVLKGLDAIGAASALKTLAADAIAADDAIASARAEIEKAERVKVEIAEMQKRVAFRLKMAGGLDAARAAAARAAEAARKAADEARALAELLEGSGVE